MVRQLGETELLQLLHRHALGAIAVAELHVGVQVLDRNQREGHVAAEALPGPLLLIVGNRGGTRRQPRVFIDLVGLDDAGKTEGLVLVVVPDTAFQAPLGDSPVEPGDPCTSSGRKRRSPGAARRTIAPSGRSRGRRCTRERPG